MVEFQIEDRWVGDNHNPLVIAEIGINHEGSFDKAIKMIDDAYRAGCEIVKFQSHIIEDEMVPAAKNVFPGNSKNSIYEIMERCALTEKEEIDLKEYVGSKNMIFLSTPFSRASADRLYDMNVSAYKIGSGECNNYPLIEHVAKFGKPIILSTGMNDLDSIKNAVEIIRKYSLPYALLHCTSIYPTPYNLVRLGAMVELKRTFPDAVIGLSDHTISIYPCLGAVSLGARILERHFTSDKKWKGPDIDISMNPKELYELINGSRIIFQALGGTKTILPEESPTIYFAYASVVSIADIFPGDVLTENKIWVKRPGTGEILARHYYDLLGKTAIRKIPKDSQLKWDDFE